MVISTVRRYLVAAVAVVALAPVAGCGLSNLSFVSDTRLHFVSPHQRALVHVPITITWLMTGFHVVPPHSGPPSRDSGYFAVFVDRAPIRPGQSLESVADKMCRRTAGCFNASYLAVRGVYTTETDSLTLTAIKLVNSYQSMQTHEATVVLLDTAGRRIGESAWYLDFRTKKVTA